MKKCLATAVLCTLCTAGIWAQGTAFTYQGRLMDNGTPFNGTIELEATLWDAATNGTRINPLRPVTRTVDVSNGIFSVSLDFSKGAFTGPERWLQIDLRTSPDPTPFTTLWPRQKFTTTPHAIVAEHLTGRVTENGLFGFYTNQVLFDNPQNYFAGDGSDLLNLNASQLASGTVPSAALGNAWQIGGNSGTTPGTHFLGTTDNQPLELKVNGFRGLRLEPNSANLPNAIIGEQNQIAPGVAAALIGGGYENRIQAGSDLSVIIGGDHNTIPPNAHYATILGGRLNSAGRFSLAAGHRAQANHGGSFLWADLSDADFPSSATNEFAIRASGGARVVTGGAGMTLDGKPVLSGLVGAAQLAPGAVSQLGTPDGSQTGAVQVINGGLVGIGTSVPGAGLHIVEGASFLSAKVLFEVQDGVGSYTNLLLPQQVAVSGNLLAVTAFFDDAVTLLDVANPSSPIIMTQLWDGNGVFTNLSGADGLALSGNLLAVAALWDNTVTLIDVSNPQNPIKLAELRDGIGGFDALQAPRDLVLSGSLLAIGSINETAVTLVDVSNPANPVLRTVLRLTNLFNEFSAPAAIGASGNLLAISSTNVVMLMDVSNPSNPIQVSIMTDNVNGFNDLTVPVGLAFSGNLLAIAGYLDNAVTLVDISNPANPQLRSVLKDGVAGYTGLSFPLGLAFSGNLLGVTALGDDAVTLVDVSNPLAPVLRGTFRHAQGGIHFMRDPEGIAFAGGVLAVVGSSSHGLTLIEPVTAEVSLAAAERVGIGTTLPAASLHVVGNVVVEGAQSVEIGADQVALGREAIATGLYATALGEGTYATGERSTAIGSGTTASGAASTALGTVTTASGGASFAAGNGSWASGGNSFAMGAGNRAAGDYSFALGQRAMAMHEGTFVWADADTPYYPGFASTGSNQFLIRATGGMGVNVAQPLGELHVGTSSGVAPLSLATRTIIIDNANENGRAAFLALAGPGGSAATNRVELELEANENQRVGIIGTTSNHEVVFRQNNITRMRLSTNGNIGIGESAPEAFLHVTSAGSTAPQLRLEQTANNDFARLRFTSTTKPFWDVAVGGANDVMNWFNSAGGNVMTLTTNGNLIVAGTISGTIANNAIASTQIVDGSIAAIDINTGSFSNTFWKVDGNAGTTPATHFLGTTDNQPLEIKVNGVRALRLENNGDSDDAGTLPDGAPNVIGGAPNNSVAPGVVGATIGGGGATNYNGIALSNRVEGHFATIGGGRGNRIRTAASHSTVAGGNSNDIGANSAYSAIGGGVGNRIQADSPYATIAGGWANDIGTNSDRSVIGGGFFNHIGANSPFAVIPGGQDNFATNYAFAAGFRATAKHTGAFVWADSINASVESTNDNSMTMRASGGYRLFSSAGIGAYLAPGSGGWVAMSDRDSKEHFESVDARAVLAKVAALSIQTWNYKGQTNGIRHIGAIAQDFKAAFGVGETDTGINTVDADGVALAAIQGLNQKLEERTIALETELKRRDAENTELRQELNEIKTMLRQFTRTKGTQP